MALSQYAHVDYWPEGWSHGHLVRVGGPVWSMEVEEAAQFVSETILGCTQDKHGGRGRNHTPADADDAYREAVRQLLTRDYDAEWAEDKRKEAVYYKWNGTLTGGRPVPEAILLPDGGGDWKVLNVSKSGDPYLYDMNGNAKKELNEVVRPPTENDMTKTDIGWRRK